MSCNQKAYLGAEDDGGNGEKVQSKPSLLDSRHIIHAWFGKKPAESEGA